MPWRTVWADDTYGTLIGLLARERPSIAHFHNTFPLISPAAYAACRQAGIPVVQSIHNYRLLCPKATFFKNARVCEACLSKIVAWPGIVAGCYRDSTVQTGVVTAMLTIHRWLRTYANQVDVYIALTEFAKQKLIQGGIPAGKIEVKPNFVSPDPGMGNGGDHFLFVGRLTPEKGVKTLLKSFKDMGDISLFIAGDGTMRRYAEEFIGDYKLENIRILGYRSGPEILSFLRSARALVFPSEWYEVHPRVTVEAFACGVPVIASRLGAMRELVEDGRTGLLFTPGDSDDLAAKVEWAWTHPREMGEMGREARREYEEKYTEERNYERLMEIYRLAMDRAPRRG